MSLSFTRTFILCTGLLLSVPAISGNLSFLDNSVLTDLSDTEVASFKAVIRQTLDESDDKDIAHWKSESSELSGKILPKISYTTNGLPCRRTLFLLSDGQKRKDHYRFDICKVDGQWQIKNSPIAYFNKVELAELEILLNSTLDVKSSGNPIAWHNKKTGNSAVIVALLPSADTDSCRQAAISLISKHGNTSSGTYLFCKNEAMEWERRLSEH